MKHKGHKHEKYYDEQQLRKFEYNALYFYLKLSFLSPLF